MLYATPFITAYVLGVTAILGLCMGSFLNCMAWRISHGESVMRGRSHCATCNHPLAARDLIPVFSWLASHGRCRYCGQHISARYPATELICMVAYVSIVMHYGLSLEAIEMLCFASILLVLSLTDLDDYIIPNGCIITAVVVRAVYIVASGLLLGTDIVAMFVESLVGVAAVLVPLLLIVLVMDKVMKRDSMGGGDLKLFTVAGFYFGWQECLFLIIAACIIGIVVAMVTLPRKQTEGPVAGQASADATHVNATHVDATRADAAETASEDRSDDTQLTRMIPFGPSIAIACWITMLFGTAINNWYLGLL